MTGKRIICASFKPCRDKDRDPVSCQGTETVSEGLFGFTAARGVTTKQPLGVTTEVDKVHNVSA